MERRQFDNYRPTKDIYAEKSPAIISLSGIKKKYSGKPKLSYMISTWNRKNQLARSLECLARQDWKEFEVLLMDDGSTEDLFPLIELFSPYLQLKSYRVERGKWHSCPSRSFKKMLPDAEGEVIAIAHPEMMLDFKAMRYLYLGSLDLLPEKEVIKYTIGYRDYIKGKYYWCSLRPQFIIENQYDWLDTLDWHKEGLDILSKSIPDFISTRAFAGETNIQHHMKDEYPWWFVGATVRECPVWEDMPIFDGHGIIDMWMLRYRLDYKIVDVVPNKPLCIHQPHLTTAIAPEEEVK